METSISEVSLRVYTRHMTDTSQYREMLLPLQSDIVYTFLHCLLRDEQDQAKLEEGMELQSL